MSKNVANNVANEKVQDYVKKSHNVEENEPKSEKTAKDVQKNCLSLTEQRLEQRYYYTKYTPKVGKPFVEIELRNYLLDLAKVRDANTVEVLEPVPSYEKYKSLETGIILADILIKNTKEENQKLKELLSKCVDELAEFNNSYYPETQELLTKIDEVLK